MSAGFAPLHICALAVAVASLATGCAATYRHAFVAGAEARYTDLALSGIEIEMRIFGLHDSLDVAIHNRTSKEVRVDWSQALFFDPAGRSHAVAAWDMVKQPETVRELEMFTYRAPVRILATSVKTVRLHARDAFAFAGGRIVWQPLLSREVDLTGKAIGLDLTIERDNVNPRRVEVRFPIRSREGP